MLRVVGLHRLARVRVLDVSSGDGSCLLHIRTMHCLEELSARVVEDELPELLVSVSTLRFLRTLKVVVDGPGEPITTCVCVSETLESLHVDYKIQGDEPLELRLLKLPALRRLTIRGFISIGPDVDAPQLRSAVVDNESQAESLIKDCRAHLHSLTIGHVSTVDIWHAIATASSLRELLICGMLWTDETLSAVSSTANHHRTLATLQLPCDNESAEAIELLRDCPALRTIRVMLDTRPSERYLRYPAGDLGLPDLSIRALQLAFRNVASLCTISRVSSGGAIIGSLDRDGLLAIVAAPRPRSL